MYFVILNIEGMKCGMCEAHICNAIRTNSKVKKIKASHKKNLITFVSNDKTEIDSIVGVIEKLGYKVLDINVEEK